jgi:hypothetical protein
MDLPEQFQHIREWLLDDLEIVPRWEWLAWDVADMEEKRFWDILLPHYQGRSSVGRLIDDRREARESHVLQAKLIFLRATFGPIKKMLRGKDIRVPRSAVTFYEEIKKQYGCEPGEYFVGSKDMLARYRACEERGDRQELELWRAALVYGAARSLQKLDETAWSKPEKPRGHIRIVEA